MRLAAVTFGLVLLCSAGALAQARPCQSERPAIEVPRLSGIGTRTNPGTRIRYRYRAGRLVEQRMHVLEAAPGAPADGTDRYGYDAAGHLVELLRWDGVHVFIDRNPAGHVERFRMGRQGRMHRAWTETRVTWSEAWDASSEAPRYEMLIQFAWTPRLVLLALPILDGGRPGTATTLRYTCRAPAGPAQNTRPVTAECERDDTEPGLLEYDAAGRLSQGQIQERFRSVGIDVSYERGLPVRVREMQATSSGSTERETVSRLEGEHIVEVTSPGFSRHLTWRRDRVTHFEERRRPHSPASPDRTTTYRYRCR